MSKRRILVVGYPKSGNTWCTRLVGALLEAPVVGFWNQPQNRERAIEGLDRVSDMEVYKGHQSLAQVKGQIELSDVVYVVRHVGDMATSGANFFGFPPRTPLGRVAYSLPLAGRVVNRVLRRNNARNLREMLRVLSEGDGNVPWCGVPWDSHVMAYRDAGAFVVRYEDLLEEPEPQCQRILRHLGVERSAEAIQRAVEKQSFAATKRRFTEAGNAAEAAFLRRGRAGCWRDDLTPAQQAFCLDRFGPALARLEYS